MAQLIKKYKELLSFLISSSLALGILFYTVTWPKPLSDVLKVDLAHNPVIQYHMYLNARGSLTVTAENTPAPIQIQRLWEIRLAPILPGERRSGDILSLHCTLNPDRNRNERLPRFDLVIDRLGQNGRYVNYNGIVYRVASGEDTVDQFFAWYKEQVS